MSDEPIELADSVITALQRLAREPDAVIVVQLRQALEPDVLRKIWTPLHEAVRGLHVPVLLVEPGVTISLVRAPRAGEVLVVRTAERWEPERIAATQRWLEERFGAGRVLIQDGLTQVTVEPSAEPPR